MKIYISSVAFLGKEINEILQIANNHAINLEFSSGMPFNHEMEAYFLNYPFPKLAHNYFPAPKVPFVLNLASINNEIRQTSINHCIQGLKLTKKANAPFFAAHAGFCIDPNPEDLGKKLATFSHQLDKAHNWQLFIKSIRTILTVAEHLEIDFYIENNVIAKFNIDDLGQNPLFCCNAPEIIKLIKEINHPQFGLLLDTAHLKVSSYTLGFNLQKAIKQLTPFIKAIHHSDNDGIADTNQPLSKAYWFLPFLSDFETLPHVIEVKKQSLSQLDSQKELLTRNSNYV